MQTNTVRRFFPHSQASIVHQDGSQIIAPTSGVEVILHTRENERDPCCAEVISGDHYAEIGLTFAGKQLSDCDGVFFLPREVSEMLTEAGYLVGEDFFG